MCSEIGVYFLLIEIGGILSPAQNRVDTFSCS